MSEEHLPATIQQETGIVRASGDVVEAFEEYRKIQTMLDQAMPECIVTIGQRRFRRKNYWRAIATAFNLTVEPVSERREKAESGDWGWILTYRATAKNGRSATGDGACFASEKREDQASEHNVRSHAHTRAFNRAVSNLVGFGEVSAEEVQAEPRRATRRPAARTEDAPEPAERLITDAQGKRLWALAAERAKKLGGGVDRTDIVRDTLGSFGIEHTNDIPWTKYDAICAHVQSWDPPVTEVGTTEEGF